MSDWPVNVMPPLPQISPFCEDSLGNVIGALSGAAAPLATGAIGTANRAWYFPFLVEVPCLAKKMFLINGTTAAGNVSIGIYDSEFNRIAELTAAQTGTSVIQEFDIVDTILLPGRYWMAVSFSNATATYFRAQPADEVMAGAGAFAQATAHPLPQTAAPSRTVSTSIDVIAMGVSFDTLI